MKDISLSRLASVTKEALLAAGAIIRKGYDLKRQVTFKSPTSPVTNIDVQAEKKIISLIRRSFPDHEFLAEESAYLKTLGVNPKKIPESGLPLSTGQYRWVIDPLDGTVNFVHGIPQSCVSIAVEKKGILLAGGIFDPFRDELFMAVLGRGATMNAKRIKVSPQKHLERSLLITGFPYDHREHAGYYLDMAKPFLKRCMDIRRFGSAAIDLAWVACGRSEGYWESNLNPWDVAAGYLLVEEAGGKVTNYQGNPLDIDRPFEVLASNGRIHSVMIKLLRGSLRR